VRDYYDILEVSPDAEPEVIDAAYRRLERRYHPDAYTGADAAERLRELDEAHAVLRDPAKRALYDRIWHYATGEGSRPESEALGPRLHEQQPERTEHNLGVNRTVDLALAVACALATTFIVLLVPFLEPARVGLGLVFVLFLPGYVLVAALYPRKDDLDLVERLALSLGLSIAVVPLIGLALNYSPWGIRLDPILAFLTLFVVLAAGVAMYRRLMLPPGEAMAIPVDLLLPKLLRLRLADRLLGLVLVLALAGLGVGGYFLATSSAGSEKFTEFYVLGLGGKAEGYPRTVDVGQQFTLMLGVVNHEGGKVRYRVRATIAGRPAASLDSLQLANKEKWEGPLTLTATQSGSNQKVEFVLYKGDNDVPYRILHLWLDVEGSPPQATATEIPRQEGAAPPTAESPPPTASVEPPPASPQPPATSTPPEAPVPSPTPSPATPPPSTYVVQPGDTLMGIAAVFGVYVAEIAAANGIPNPNLIYPGQTLVIPGTSP
jgi:uncharacterized membrane protein